MWRVERVLEPPATAGYTPFAPTMPTPSPFSQYASRFINASFLAQSTATTSQPLFYSFTDASERSGDRSRDLRGDDSDHDGDDPKLRGDDDDGLDPFHEHAPLIDSELEQSRPRPQHPQQQQLLQPTSQQTGWRTHTSLPVHQSIASSSSSGGSFDGPPDGFFDHEPPQSNLRESLLPRDGVTRPVFSLPGDPRRVPLRKYNDPTWTALWCTGLTACLVGWVVIMFAARVSHCVQSRSLRRSH